MNDWRKIEAAIVDFLDREDLHPFSGDGDYCLEFERRGMCCELNVTKLARELADMMAKA